MEMYEIDESVDHNKEIPADERTGSAAYSLQMLCKQDKKQLDRIEAMLKRLLDEESDS